MKKLSSITLICGLAGLMLASCGGGAKDGKEKADSANSAVDSNSKVQPNTGRAVTEPDAKFAVEAANGGMSEVILGKLAQEKA